jgi:hypothetical protein
MNGDAIREWLNREPFKPFVLRLSSGEAYEVRHPENVAIGKNRFIIVDPQTDRDSLLTLVHLNAIEGLQLA